MRNPFKPDPDSAHINFPPPLIPLSGLIIGLIINWIYPIPILSDPKLWWIGLPLIINGGLIFLKCKSVLKRAQTNIKPWMPTVTIVSSGPYRFSRNPIYLAFIIVGIGIALCLNSLWILVTQPFVLWLLQILVIIKEEAYLEYKFKEKYMTYKNQTRRWL